MCTLWMRPCNFRCSGSYSNGNPSSGCNRRTCGIHYSGSYGYMHANSGTNCHIYTNAYAKPNSNIHTDSYSIADAVSDTYAGGNHHHLLFCGGCHLRQRLNQPEFRKELLCGI